MKKVILKLLKTITIVAFLMYAGITICGQQIKIEDLKEQRVELNKEKELVEAKIKEIKEELEQDSDDDAEKFARERGYIKEGEKVIIGIGG